MTVYAWTISKPGMPDIKRVMSLAELRDALLVLDFLGFTPPEFVTPDAEMHDHGTYTHNKGSKDEWSLTWTKVDSDSQMTLPFNKWPNVG